MGSSVDLLHEPLEVCVVARVSVYSARCVLKGVQYNDKG